MLKTTCKQVYFDYIQPHKVLLLILLSAFLLRIWGIWNADSTDEYNEVCEALRVCSGHLNLERFSKRFFLYILSLEYGVYYLLGWLVNIFQSPNDFAIKIVRDLTPLFMLGRATSAVFGTASIFMTYMIGKVLVSRQVGLLAALFLCLNVVNIQLSHYARVDATLCLVVLISFYFVVKLYNSSSQSLSKYYILAGFFSGIAFQTKLPAVILIIPFLLAHLSQQQEKHLVRRILCKDLGFYCIFFILGLIVGNPAILFAPHKFIISLLGKSKVYTTPLNETKSEYIGFIAYLIYFYNELGLVLVLLSTYSLFRALLTKKKDDILVLSFMIPFYILMGLSWYMVSESYMIPLMPFLYLLTSKYLIEVIEKIGIVQKFPPKIVMLLVGIFLIHQSINVIKFEISLCGKNTRVLAKEWIEQNIPFDSKILVDSGKSINSFAPKIAASRDSIIRVLSSKKQALEKGELYDPSKIVDTTALLYYELLLKTIPHESYDITSTMYGLAVKSIDYYIANQYHYFIISKQMKEKRTCEFFTERSPPEIAAFYNSLDSDNRVNLIKTIGPTSTNRGNTFYIYKINSSAF